MVFTAVVVTEATLRALLVVSVACFPLSAVVILVPPTVRAPVIVVAPVTVSVELSTAAPSACSSRVATTSRPWMSALHVTLAIDSCEVELIDAPAFAAIVVMMSVPFKHSGPARIMLEPMIAEPVTSIDGVLTGHENTALPAEIPSRSTPLESARLRVEDAGFIRARAPSRIFAALTWS